MKQELCLLADPIDALEIEIRLYRLTINLLCNPLFVHAVVPLPHIHNTYLEYIYAFIIISQYTGRQIIRRQMIHMKIIGLAGLARSGKDTVADYIESKYGFRKFVLSDVLKDELRREGKEQTKENMADLGNTLRKKSGKDVVAKMLYERCKDMNKITVVGFRSPEEVEFFRKKAESFTLIEVRAPEKSRIKWASKQEDIMGRDRNDISKKGLEHVFSMAEIKIDNDSTLEALYKKVGKIMKDIG